MVRRSAVVVGCQYPEPGSEVVGSLTNAHNIAGVLKDNFDFSYDRMTILHNVDLFGTGPEQPTGENIRNAINGMVDQCGVGDLLFFYFSGHGGVLPATNDFPEEEYIVPTDHNIITSIYTCKTPTPETCLNSLPERTSGMRSMTWLINVERGTSFSSTSAGMGNNLITSQEFRGWVNRLPSGATFVVISDSCNSGGLLGQAKEQTGASDNTSISHGSRRPGFLPLESSIEYLAPLSNIKSPRVGDHLLALFGSKVSPRFSRSPQPYVLQPTKSDKGILLSACTPDGEAYFKTTNPPYGYFTNALEKAMREKDFIITNKQLVMRTREIVLAQNKPQHPCLYCSDNNVDKRFLS